MSSLTLKWLGDVGRFTNVGNLGDFLRMVERKAPSQDSSNVVPLKRVPGAVNGRIGITKKTPARK